MWVDADIDMLPIYVKEGAVIPRYPVQQYVGEKTIEELTLEVYYAKGAEVSHVYEDSGDGYDYKKGRFSLLNFRLTGKDNELILHQHKTGTYETSYDTIAIKLIGLPFKIKEIEIDNVKQNLNSLDFKKEYQILKVPKNFTEIDILG